MENSYNYTFKVTGYPKNQPGFVNIDLHLKEVELPDGRWQLIVDRTSFMECLEHEAHLMPDMD